MRLESHLLASLFEFMLVHLSTTPLQGTGHPDAQVVNRGD